MLQACHTNNSVRHAAIALASLHEEFIVGQAQDRDSESFALRQYTKALQGTRMSLDDKDQSIIAVLMSCVLFFCFESLRGELASAIIHLRSGLDILYLSDRQENHLSIASKTVIKHDILGIFAILGFQANYFINERHPVNQTLLVDQLRSLSTNPLNRISTLAEAQVKLYACLNGTMFSDHAEDPIVDVNAFSDEYHMTRCAQLIVHGGRSADFERGRKRAISALEEWNTSFKEFLHVHEESMNSIDIKGLTLLKIHHLTAVLILNTACGSATGQAVSESATPHYKQVIDWSKFLLAGGQMAETRFTPELSPEVGIIAPLFFVATNCPEPTLRAAARSILASRPRREGIWDATLAVKIIDEINIQAVSATGMSFVTPCFDEFP